MMVLLKINNHRSYESLVTNRTWTVVDLPPGHKTLNAK